MSTTQPGPSSAGSSTGRRPDPARAEPGLPHDQEDGTRRNHPVRNLTTILQVFITLAD
jgi:hypothetical protein